VRCVSSDDIFERLRRAVAEGDPEKTEKLTKEALEKGVSPLEALEKGLIKGVREVGERFGKGELFITDLILGGEAMKAGADILKPVMKAEDKGRKLGKVLIGTVKGDIHSIGKNIVATMLESEGFEVHDLGEDIPEEAFVEKVKELKPDVLGLSSLMTMTMPAQKDVIEMLAKEKIRDKVKVLIGGAPTTREWADEIGADGWAGDAVSATKESRKVLGKS